MTHFFKDPGNAGVGEILAFVDGVVRSGGEAAVPASCLPVLVYGAGCRPRARGETAGHFVFREPPPVLDGCPYWERGLAVALMAALAPVFVTVAVLVFVFDGAPVFFRQERYGCEGHHFTLFKFRTMVRRSERLHARLQRKLGKKGQLFKLESDPRVTRVGGFLRWTFLDELPQLFNVARGEMRLVGPRPLPASDQGHYTRPEQALRLKGLPGMTGLWQVSGRNERTFDEMCLLDAYYLGNRSAALDLWIVGRTLRLVVQQIGLCRKPEYGREQPGGVEDAGHNDP
ncbi:MAG: sugar transferase [Kiritimatiellae bacterium]|nr:sugar transferase [Kiritimatiellia bacterium]